MKIDKAELATKIGKIKNVIPKKAVVPAMQSILLKEGYLIGSNQEITIKAKLEGSEDESFLIPQKAFDLIGNLPAGEMEITSGKNHQISIRSGKIKNKFASMDPDMYNTGAQDKGEMSSMSIEAEKLKECMSHVLFAVASYSAQPMMSAMCLDCHDGYLNFVGLDGHQIAWDKVEYEGDFKLLIPRTAIERLLALDLEGEITIRHSKLRAIFDTEEYIVETRLVEGAYYPFEKMFSPMPNHTKVKKKKLIDAINRASLCIDIKEPIRIDFADDHVKVYLQSGTADYAEDVPLEEKWVTPFTIGFDAKLLMNALKVFENEEVELSLIGGKQPVLIEEDKSNQKAIVLPVSI